MATYYWREVLGRVRSILDEIDGLKVPAGMPPSIDSRSQLPMALVALTPLRRQRNGADAVLENRTVEIQVFLTDPKKGVPLEAETDAYALDMEEKIFDQFDGRRRLQLSDNGLVTDAVATADDGFQTLEYPAGSGNTFLGFIVRLNVSRNFSTQQKV